MTLMVGGPANGKDYEGHSDHVLLPKPVSVPVSHRTPALEVSQFQTILYRRKKLIWFGRILTIMAYEDTTDQELDNALMLLVLNETGMKLWRSGKPRPLSPMERQ